MAATIARDFTAHANVAERVFDRALQGQREFAYGKFSGVGARIVCSQFIHGSIELDGRDGVKRERGGSTSPSRKDMARARASRATHVTRSPGDVDILLTFNQGGGDIGLAFGNVAREGVDDRHLR